MGLISASDYRRDLDSALQVLNGRSDALSEELRDRMAKASAALQFEEAARLRDQLAGLTELQSRQIASAPRVRDVDVVALVGEPGRYGVTVLTVREGQSLGTTNFFPAALGEPAETLAEFLLLHYTRQPAPAEVVINHDLPDHEALAEALIAVAGRTVHLHRGHLDCPTLAGTG